MAVLPDHVRNQLSRIFSAKLGDPVTLLGPGIRSCCRSTSEEILILQGLAPAFFMAN